MSGPTSTLLRSVSARSKTFPQRVVAEIAKVVEKELKTQVARDTGGDSRLSGMGNARVSTKSEIVGSSTSILTIRPARRTTGMWVILEDGTRTHQITARRGRRRSGVNETRSRALRIGDDWTQGPVRVSGSPGKGTWSKAIKRARPGIERVGREELERTVSG